MSSFFDDFEQGVREELVDVLMRSFEKSVLESGGEMLADGRYAISASTLPAIIAGVTSDSVMFALRRYHEWTEAQPR